MTDIKITRIADIAGAVGRVRDSHLMILQGIATHAEKRRAENDARLDKLRADNLLKVTPGNGAPGV